MEIERKFLLSSLPEQFNTYEAIEMEQGYLITDGCTLRIRRAGEECYLTLKQKSGNTLSGGIAIENEEYETEIPRQAYEAMKQLVIGGFVTKTRTRIPYLNHVIEVDVFHGALEGLVFAEIEYLDREDALTLPLPSWFSKDVSSDKRFRNTKLRLMEEEEIRDFLTEIRQIALVL